MGGSRSGFCLWVLHSQWPFRVGVASGAEEEPSTRGIVQAPMCLGSFCGKGRVLFSATVDPPGAGVQSTAVGSLNWNTHHLVSPGCLWAWQATYAGSWSSH